MKLSAALQYEGMRDDPQSWNKIYLNKDGKFFHAYQWSAWLLKRFVGLSTFDNDISTFNKPIKSLAA